MAKTQKVTCRIENPYSSLTKRDKIEFAIGERFYCLSFTKFYFNPGSQSSRKSRFPDGPISPQISCVSYHSDQLLRYSTTKFWNENYIFITPELDDNQKFSNLVHTFTITKWVFIQNKVCSTTGHTKMLQMKNLTYSKDLWGEKKEGKKITKLPTVV